MIRWLFWYNIFIKIYLEIEVGKNINQINLTKEEESKIIDKKQILSLFLVIDDYLFYIDDNFFYNDENEKIYRYSSKISTSYEIVHLKINIKMIQYLFMLLIILKYFMIYLWKNMNW